MEKRAERFYLTAAAQREAHTRKLQVIWRRPNRAHRHATDLKTGEERRKKPQTVNSPDWVQPGLAG